MDLTETGHADVDRLVQDRVKWRTSVNTVVNLWGPYKMKNFSISRRIINSQEGFCSIDNDNERNS
jgi:hypothetical protein